MELLLCLAFAPIIAFAVKFLLGYAGLALRSPAHARIDRWITLALWGQCLVIAGSFYLAGHFGLFQVARVWYTLFTMELVAAMGYFLWHAAQTQRAEFWLMCGVLGTVGAALGIELLDVDRGGVLARASDVGPVEVGEGLQGRHDQALTFLRLRAPTSNVCGCWASWGCVAPL